MSTLATIQQTSREAWHGTRLGRFTASTIGGLMTEPKTLTDEQVEQYAHLVPDRFKVLQSGPNKGNEVEIPGYASKVMEAAKEQGAVFFGATALSQIIEKAIERVTGTQSWGTQTASMKRGILLEPAGIHLLSREWKPIDGCSWQAYGDNAGATPDGLVDEGTATMDLKCPENGSDLFRFADEVPDGDFEALENWDKGYAWQIMMQAKVSGTRYAYLVYFTDRLPIYPLGDEDRDELQAIIDHQAGLYSQEGEWPWKYDYATSGYFYVARRFELTKERSERIDRVLRYAEQECVAMVPRYRKLIERQALSSTEEKEAEQAVQELVEDHVMTEKERMEACASFADFALEEMRPHLDALPKGIAEHGIRKAMTHIEDAVTVLERTLKDLK